MTTSAPSAVDMIDVLIVGAGPSGLTAANVLARYGASLCIVDTKDAPAPQSRAALVHTRTLELFDKLGLATEAIAQGVQLTNVRVFERGRYLTSLPLSSPEAHNHTPFPFALSLPQSQNEALLLKGLEAQGVNILWKTAYLRHETGEESITAVVQTAGEAERTITARWLVGADGASSAVRRALNVPFEGSSYEQALFLADVEMTASREITEFSLNLTHGGFVGILPLNNGLYRLFGALTPQYAAAFDVAEGSAIALTDLQRWFDEYFYVEAQLTTVKWASIYRSHRLMAERFTSGRGFLIGDAAHIHSPAGGQGMNLGIGDGFNLGWKLGMVAKGLAAPALLDSYQPERMPAAKIVVNGSDRGFEMEATTSPRVVFFRRQILPRLLKTLTRMRFVRVMIFKLFSQLWISYRGSPAVSEALDVTPGHICAGDRAPLGTLRVDGVEITTFDLIRGIDHHLLWFDGTGGDGYERLKAALAHYVMPVQTHIIPIENAALRVQYGVGAEAKLFLIRPDGHVGFVGQPNRLADFEAYLSRLYAPKAD